MKHLDSYSVGENSKVTLTDVNPNFLPNISITLGMNCTLEIEGILVLNSKLEIIMRDNCDLFLAAGQMMNEKVSLNMGEKSNLKIGRDCLWGETTIWTSDFHSILKKGTLSRINPPADIQIGNAVWFGHQSLILKGAQIGNDSVTGISFSVAQANLSESKRAVVRGIHYSLSTIGQAKWVTCVSGAIKDVIVDIRPASATFGKYVAVDLVGGSGRAILIAAGLGHGFVSLEDGSTVAYLVSSPFSPTEEFEINPLDPSIGIEWGFSDGELLLSPKDASAPTLSERKTEGKLPK